MAIELVPLTMATITLSADQFLLPDTPTGTRLVVEVEDAVLEGERLSGKLKGHAAADWLTLSPAGIGTLDVRATFETHDGALVFTTYRGRSDFSTPGNPIYAAPLYDTGDERYAWLNAVQAVGKGALDGLTLTYEIYELR